MRRFEEIQEIAAGRQGGKTALEALLPQALTPEVLGRTHDNRWLSVMTKCLFQAGFNWSVIEARWTGFEAAFDGFDPRKIALSSEEDIDRLLADRRIVRNGAKIAAVIRNARLLVDLADKHGSAAAFFAAWPSEDYVGLLRFVEKQGARMGGLTGQRAFRGDGPGWLPPVGRCHPAPSGRRRRVAPSEITARYGSRAVRVQHLGRPVEHEPDGDQPNLGAQHGA